MGFLSKIKFANKENLYYIVDPDKDEEDIYLDAEVLVAINKNEKSKVSFQQVNKNNFNKSFINVFFMVNF